MFVKPAYAQSAAVDQNILINILPFLLIFAVMYFLIIRPQRLESKKRSQMLSSIRRGDTIITGGGFIAKVTRVIDDSEIEVDLGNGNKVLVVRNMIANVRIKGEPAANQNDKK